jgi:hypothetical protein
MNNGPENIGNGAAATDDRFAGQLGYRGGSRRDLGGHPGHPGDPGNPEHAPRNGNPPSQLGGGVAPQVGSVMDSPLPVPPTMSLGDLDDLAEPVFPPAGWLDSPAGELADHPLLRGLLFELPPRGTAPSADWLDRWFEAARSILELLYVQHSASSSRR